MEAAGVLGGEIVKVERVIAEGLRVGRVCVWIELVMHTIRGGVEHAVVIAFHLAIVWSSVLTASSLRLVSVS